jgi:hypothetical protein
MNSVAEAVKFQAPVQGFSTLALWTLFVVGESCASLASTHQQQPPT